MALPEYEVNESGPMAEMVADSAKHGFRPLNWSEPRPIDEMTDREIQEEILLTMRTVGKALDQFQKMGPAGMMKAVMTGNFTGK